MARTHRVPQKSEPATDAVRKPDAAPEEPFTCDCFLGPCASRESHEDLMEIESFKALWTLRYGEPTAIEQLYKSNYADALREHLQKFRAERGR